MSEQESAPEALNLPDTRNTQRTLSDDALMELRTFADVAEALGGVEELGDYILSLDVLNKDDKLRLVGTPFAIIDYRFSDGDMGPFVSLRVMTEDGKVFVVNDGSTGIYAQMERIADKRDPANTRAILCAKGLRVSNYEYQPADGSKPIPASTFYLA